MKRTPNRLRNLFVIALTCCILPALRADDADTISRAWAAIDAGRFAEAEKLLRADGASLERPVIDGLSEMLEIMRRIRLDYSLDAEQVLAKLRASIPDVAAADVERWRENGELQHRLIDGEVHYFNRAAGNLLRFSEDARRRRAAQSDTADARFDIPAHVARLLALADENGQTLVYPVKHRIKYELRVKAGNTRLRPGALVRCWLPYPQEYGRQGDIRLISTEPSGARPAPVDAPQRTLYFKQTVDDKLTPPTFRAEFEYVTRAYVPHLDPTQVVPYDVQGAVYREFTAERPPHIVFSPEVKRLAAEIVGDETNPLIKARKIFRWLDANVPWCSEMEYSTIRCLSAKGLAARRGDCGVQGMTFITLCRAAGVPARWQSGWQTLPGRWNMHDWSEFYVAPWGWLPADASYGVQDHPDPRVRDFFCGHMDPYRLIVNLDYARELYPPKTSFRSEPNDFQRGEIEIDVFNLYFDEWTWDFDVETTTLDDAE